MDAITDGSPLSDPKKEPAALRTLLGRTKYFGEGRKFSGFEAEHMGAQRRSPIRRLRATAPATAPQEV